MKSQMLLSSPDAFREGIRQESFINIVLKTGHVNTVLPFLLTHEIPFTLSSTVETVESTDLSGKETSMEIAEPSFNKVEDSGVQQRLKLRNTKKNNPLERIFRKYIIKGIESIPPNTEKIAEEAGLSLSKFKALFKKYYGKPFYQIYIEHKMAYAAKLLREGYNSVAVSERIGYVHPIKFNKMFQKYYGMTPYKYQKAGQVNEIC